VQQTDSGRRNIFVHPVVNTSGSFMSCVDMDVVCKYIPSGVGNFILVRPTDKTRHVFLFAVPEITSACTRNMGRSKETKYVLISYKFVSLIKISPRKLTYRFTL